MTDNVERNNDTPEILSDWHRRISRFQRAHTRTAAIFEKRYIFNGCSIISLTLFAAVCAWSDSFYVNIASSGISIVAAILAGVQTFLRYPQRSEKHRGMGAGFGSLRRVIEQHAISNPSDVEQVEFVNRTRKKWDALTKESPTIPQGIWEKTKGKEMIFGKSSRAVLQE